MESSVNTQQFSSPSEFLDNFVKEKESIGIIIPKNLHAELAHFLATHWTSEFSRVQTLSSFWYSDWLLTYFYGILSGRGFGIPIEIPHDQYNDVKNFVKTIIDNSEWSIDDWIIKSDLTYKQARNIVKSGNIDSLFFDIKNTRVVAECAFGISFMVSYARYRWEGVSNMDAARCAVSDSLQAGGTALLSGVLSAQIMRTHIATGLTVPMKDFIVKPLYKTTLGKTGIEKLAQWSLGKSVYGVAAINHVSKLLRSNVITGGVTTLVLTAPDAYRAAISQNISWAQFGKNLASNIAGVAGGTAGWAAGTAAGAALGSIFPGVGTVIGGLAGGLLGAMGIGMAASKGTKVVLDQFIIDDAVQMLELVQKVFAELCSDYLLSEKELEAVIESFKDITSPSWLRDMYGSGKRNDDKIMFAKRELEPLFISIINRRPKVTIPTYEEMKTIFGEIGKNLNDIEKGLIFPMNVTGSTNNEDEKLAIKILEFMAENSNKEYLIQQVCSKLGLKYNKASNILEDLKDFGRVSYHDGRYTINQIGIDLVDGLHRNETFAESQKICPHCGHISSKEDKYCSQCGNRFH